jgi:hypothetical protein
MRDFIERTITWTCHYEEKLMTENMLAEEAKIYYYIHLQDLDDNKLRLDS